MAGIGADAFGLVGAMNAIAAPGYVQPQKAGAEAAHPPAEAAVDGEYAKGCGGAPRAGGHGVLAHLRAPLPDGEAFLLHIDMDDVGGRLLAAGRQGTGGECRKQRHCRNQPPPHVLHLPHGGNVCASHPPHARKGKVGRSGTFLLRERGKSCIIVQTAGRRLDA